MRILAISDLHVDYEYNQKWVANISQYDYTGDVLVVAGDISDSLNMLEWTLKILVGRFRGVVFTPGNHDLWCFRDKNISSSLDKFMSVCAVADVSGASMGMLRADGLCILPLLSWYDYSFGQPTKELLECWMDYRACRWPSDYEIEDVAAYFEQQNQIPELDEGVDLITVSHFLPRIDVLPGFSPRILNPVLGSARIERQIRRMKTKIHIYGHSHINQYTQIDGVTYVNNALGYPHETWITAKRLVCVRMPSSKLS